MQFIYNKKGVCDFLTNFGRWCEYAIYFDNKKMYANCTKAINHLKIQNHANR